MAGVGIVALAESKVGQWGIPHRPIPLRFWGTVVWTKPNCGWWQMDGNARYRTWTCEHPIQTSPISAGCIIDWNNPFVVMAMKLLRFERFTYICPLSEIYIEIMIARPPRTPWSWSPEDHLKLMQICHLDPSGVQFPFPIPWFSCLMNAPFLLVNSTNTAKNERLSNPYLVSHCRCGDIPVLVGHPHVRSVKSIIFPSGVLNSNLKDRKHGTVTVSSFVVP